MSGHSKWHNIRVRKTKMDAQRGKLFAKCIREITIAARAGGKDPDANPRLRQAIDKAKEINMPQENIQKAILRGTGELPGVSLEEITLEGYGPVGVALMIQVATDNRQRTVAEIRHLLGKHGGSLGEAGCTAWQFLRKGLIQVKAEIDEDRLLEIVLNAGAEDLKKDGDIFQIVTAPEECEAVAKALEQAGINPFSREITLLPQNTVKVGEKDAPRVLKLMEAVEDHDDVQAVHANFDIPEEVMEKVASQT